jgi:recombination protein RecR
MSFPDKFRSAGAVGPGAEIDRLIQLFARLPGLGPRSAQRLVLTLIKKREQLMAPLAEALATAAESIVTCATCGNLDTHDPCHLCADPGRDDTLLCVVEEVDDLWAMERAGIFRGRYHVLGGVLSAIDGVGPDDLGIARLAERAGDDVQEVILALSATVDGQATAHYVADRLKPSNVKISALAHGLPMGGELDYLDEGTLTAALKSRREV